MKIDIKLLTDWVGPEGAIAALERSNLTNAELMALARESGIDVDKKMARRQLSIELVMTPLKRIHKSVEYLLTLSSDELKSYFGERMVSNTELIHLLSELGIAPGGKIRGKLIDYAAREISELGLFERVAAGSGEDRRK